MARRESILVLLAALAVAALVLAVLYRGPVGGRLDATAVAAAGGEVGAALTRRVWVAGFLPAVCPPGCAATAELDRLAAALPPAVPLVRLPLGPGTAPGHRALALGSGFDASRVDALEAGTDALLLAVVDRAGRVHSHHDGQGQAALDEARFLTGLDHRPRLHAILNATSALLLAAGFVCIRRRRVGAHLACMGSAALVTLAFLASYLHYHYYAGSTPFQGTGISRPVYFGVLISHTLLAALVAPLAVTVLFLALRRRFERHRRIARLTLPLWLYVSVSGVLVYFMLYVWFPGPR